VTNSANGQFVRQIFDEVLASQAPQFLFLTLKWAVIGGLLGLVVAILSLILFRKLGWYRSAWRFEGWVRWPLWILTVLAAAGLVATAGFFVGVIRGSEQVMRHSQLATKVFPLVSDALADGVAAAQVFLSDTNATTRSQTNITARIENFRQGEWEVNAPALLRQLDELQSGAVSNLVAEVEARLVAGSPQLQSGLPNKLLHHSLRLMGTMVVERKVNQELKRAHADDFYHAVRDRLVSAARQRGSPDTITHQELSEFLVQEVVVPGVMKPIRVFAGGQVKVFLVLALLSVVIPPGAFKLTCGRAKQKTPGEPGAPP
jgi:hypothetical protein